MRRRQRQSPVLNTSLECGIQNSYYQTYKYSVIPFVKSYTSGTYHYEDICLDETHPGPPYLNGGPLCVLSYSNPFQLCDVGHYVGGDTLGFWDEYIGGFVCGLGRQSGSLGPTDQQCISEAIEPGSVFSDKTNAGDYGATGWNKFRPGNPTADLGVFLGEIKDVPRMLKGTAKFFQDAWKAIGGTAKKPSRDMANHWLSYQFGWLPFISDLRKFHKTYVDLDKRIAHIKRNNGRWCKRGGSIVDEASTEIVSGSESSSLHWPALVSSLYSTPAGSHTITMNNMTKVWFEGSFRYWIPDIETPQWRRRAVAELYGAIPNPALIWELTPFSWLADWVSNVGDIVSNMDDGWADNLAAKGAYVMKTTETVGRVESTNCLKSGTLHQTWEFPISWKTREGASPFGFGLTGVNFSPRQWSILAALGIQKFR